MASHRIGRDENHYNPSRPTDTDDEDNMPETVSFVNKLPSEMSTIYSKQPTAISTGASTSKTSFGPPDRSSRNPNGPYTARPSWDSDDDNGRGPPPMSTTLVTKTAAYGGHNGVQTSPVSTVPTQTPTVNSSSSLPTSDGFSGLQNHGAENNPNRTPTYAAAGVTPVVVIIIGFVVFFCIRKRRRQRQAVTHGHVEEMKMQPKPVMLPYTAPLSPPPAVLPQYPPSSPSSSHPPTASSSQPIILGPIPSANDGGYLTGMDTSDLVSLTSTSNISRTGTLVDRDPFADGRSLEEAPPPYRPSSLPPASLASTSRNSSVRIAAYPQMTSQTRLTERSPFDDPEDDEVSELSGPTPGSIDAMSDVSDCSYQADPVLGGSPFS